MRYSRFRQTCRLWNLRLDLLSDLRWALRSDLSVNLVLCLGDRTASPRITAPNCQTKLPVASVSPGNHFCLEGEIKSAPVHFIPCMSQNPFRSGPHYFVFPTSQCGFTAGRRRGDTTTESRRPGFMCICSCRAPHLQDQYRGADRRSYE